MVTNPKSSPENEAWKNWLASLADKGVEVVIPEIADYEVRREPLRADEHDAGDAAGCGVLGNRQEDGPAIGQRRLLGCRYDPHGTGNGSGSGSRPRMSGI
jgi:hypothetical protein